MVTKIGRDIVSLLILWYNGVVMNMEEYAKRKTPRLQGFDYNSVGTYFITICTQNRRCILSHIVGTGVLDCPQVELTKYGEIAEKYIKQLDDFYDHIIG